MKAGAVVFAGMLLLAGGTLAAHAGESCDVEKVIGAKVEEGIYKINVKREESNLYKVTGADIYIKTRMCLELAYGDEALLEIESPYGYTIGEIHFLH